MKKIFVLLFAINLIVTGCNENEERNLILSQTDIGLTQLETLLVSITGGSGVYSATISNPDIAEIKIDSESNLFIEAKERGTAIITVFDEKDRKSVECLLSVSGLIESIQQYTINDIQYVVEAEAKDAIEADIRENILFSIGNSFVFDNKAIIIYDYDGKEILRGSYSSESMSAPNIPESYIPESYKLFPPETQMLFITRYNMVFNDFRCICDMIVSKGKPSTYSGIILPYHFDFYEDLTEYYKSRYPDAGVKGVVRILVLHRAALQ